MLKTSLSLSAIAMTASLGLTSIAIEPAQASHTYLICNETNVRNSFTLSSGNRRRHYSINPKQCWEFWGFRTIEFIDHRGRVRRYNLQNGKLYVFDFRPNRTIDLFVF